MYTKVAMLLDHSGHFDTRVLSEARVLSSNKYIVKVFCLKTDSLCVSHKKSGIIFEQCPINFDNTIPYLSKLSRIFKKNTTTLETNPIRSSLKKESHKPNLIKRLLGTFFVFRNNYKAVARYVEEFQPDIIHAHDLSMLYAGAKLASNLNGKLIYDAHEFERSRNDKQTQCEQLIRNWYESRYIAKADRVITVSDSIADELVKLYKITRPIVLLNVPEDVSINNQNLSVQKMGFSDSKTLGIYVGTMKEGRGIEIACKVLSKFKNIQLILLGEIDSKFYHKLNSIIQDLCIETQVIFLRAVPANQIVEIARLCDFGWIPIQNSCLSYDFSLPNKLFQYWEASIPILSTPLYETRQFIEYFDCGEVAEGFHANSQAKGLERLLSKLSYYKVKGQNRNEAEYSYTFKAMSGVLLSVYCNITNNIDNYSERNSLPHRNF